MPTSKPARKKGAEPKKKGAEPKSFRCNECGRAVRIPPGWTRGPAVRRHYWAKHRERMPHGNRQT